MSDIATLAKVRDITGKIIHLGMFESVRDLKVEGNVLTLAINTARYSTARGGHRVTKRGVTLYAFRRDERTDTWTHTGTVPVWWSTDELHGLPSRERDAEWEELCYRPGTARNPLDNAARRRQNGYRGEASR